MDNEEYTRFSGTGKTHEGSDYGSPYPVSRLAPPISLVDVAREIAEADKMLASRAEGQLQVIAEQIRRLQERAAHIMDKTRRDHELHRARCSFKRIPGNVYYLYRGRDGQAVFSMLSPADWGAEPPHEFQGAFRLENDMSWTEVE
jgi:hypothetical protein